MSDFYIYASRYQKQNEQEEILDVSITVIFCPGERFHSNNIQIEIRDFYEKNYQTDEILIIGGEFSKAELLKIFITQQEDTFKHIPHREVGHLSEHLHIVTFDKDGNLNPLFDLYYDDSRILASIINDGLVQIFKTRGGLIESMGDAHHFVFPSGKHCDKFLRTGNVLMNTAEIYFIAFRLLGLFKEDVHKKIYCDTSSINTLALALLELKRKLLGSIEALPIESFSSYEGLFSRSVRFFDNSLILISSSTSGNILDRIIEHDSDVVLDNIAILFFLGPLKDFISKQKNIVCNLTHSEKNYNGILHYHTYSEKDCPLCKSGSYPVEVKGDVFLLEKPKINRITLNTTDAPKKLSAFVKQFRSEKRIEENILKVNYKETHKTQVKYEVYFDMFKVLEYIESNPEGKKYKAFRDKLHDYINQYIPSNLKYLIALPDMGSLKLASMILESIKENYQRNRVPVIVPFDDVQTEITDEEEIGSAVIIASCISNGKNLLYLSRTFRNFDKLKLIYFVGLARTNNKQEFEFLKSNLKQGNYGKETNSFVEVELFYCNKDSKRTSWIFEKDFLENDILDIAERNNLTKAYNEFQKRIRIIDESLGNDKRGISNGVFYENTSGNELQLRKGFAFINFERNIEDISQADVYFCMSSIINELRNVAHHDHCLKQSEYVRNVLDPANFNRFNDGIIQASILRAAKPSELSYHMDSSLSSDMKIILEKIIDEHSTPQGEGLVEFLYAISIEKLTLKKEDLVYLMKKVSKITDNGVVSVFCHYIDENIIKQKLSNEERIELLETENKNLKAQIESLNVKEK